MPVYVYRCPTCGSEHEESRPVESRDRKRPLCYHLPVDYFPLDPSVMELVIQPAELHFKGDGWTPKHH